MKGNATLIKIYNNLVRKIVTQQTMHLGIDSPEALKAQAKMFRMVRRDYPYSSQVRGSDFNVWMRRVVNG